jgi:hypothetical protein
MKEGKPEKIAAEERNLSSVPTAKETLIETFRLWRHREKNSDREINLRNEQTALKLARALFEDSYNYFEMFLDESGLDSRRQECFRECVFQMLVREKTLGDLPALAEVIAQSLPCFFQPVELVELVQALEEVYQKQVIEQYPAGLPQPVASVDKVEKLPQLVLGILKAGDL